MIERSIVHIGLPKTGTTSIQRSLALSRLDLLNGGVIFPLAGSLTQEDGSINHHPLAKSVQSRSGSPATQSTQDTLDAFREEIQESDAHTLIISSECFGWELLAEDSVRRLKSILPGGISSIVLFVRSVTDLAERMYMQDLLYNGNTLSASDWLELNRERLDLPVTWLRWASVFGPERIFVQQYQASNDAISAFSDVSGLQLRELDPTESRSNPGVSLLLAPFLRALNERAITWRALQLAIQDAEGRTIRPGDLFRLFSADELEPILSAQLAQPDIDDASSPRFDQAAVLPLGYLDRTLLECVSPEVLASFTEQLIVNLEEATPESRATQVETAPGFETDGYYASSHIGLGSQCHEAHAKGPSAQGLRSILQAVQRQDSLVAQANDLEAERDALVADRDAWVAHAEALAVERDALVADRDAWVAHAEALAVERDALVADRDAWVAHAEALAVERDALVADRDAHSA